MKSLINRILLPVLFVLVILAFLPCAIRLPVSAGSNAVNSYYVTTQRLQGAASYVENRYDPRVGLVSESEDNGSNVPDGTPCWRTFWVYDDNLWCSEALKPFDSAMANNISITDARYVTECGKSDLFEVVIGEIIPTTIHARSVISVSSFMSEGANFTIWADRHQPQDGGTFYDANQYADLCFYLSLDYNLLGNRTVSEQWFRTGESYWHGYGFLDKAANATGLYQNYKLGLYLFAANVTGFASTIFAEVEKTAWSYQEANGGIASESYFNGTTYGTANVETTSILLLTYNTEALAQARITPSVKSFLATPNPFSPKGNVSKETTTVKATFSVTVKWMLQATSLSNSGLRTWFGIGSSLSVVWDGKNASGILVPDGTYNLRLSGADLFGTAFTTEVTQVTVDTKPPTLTSISVSPASFSPRSGQTAKITYTLSESCYVTIIVYNSAGTRVRTLVSNMLQSRGSHSVTWNGKASSGIIVPAGTYTIRIYATDRAGNKATLYPTTKTVKVT